ncbi:MAG TPA: hypothetical protein PKD96_04590 [Candidatus Absconditabacterales bacterium]|nr:hypothetical protein [Candidatus Absconditabacterales bacterium]HMT27559.1 hypothetical protein [Candidatus Absconditabacterales bacterium]
MGKTQKAINKRVAGAIIGTTILGVGGLSMTPKGKSFRKKTTDFLKSGINEMKKELKKLDDEDEKSEKDSKK